MAAVNDPNFYAKRDQERRAVADQIAAGRAHQAFQDRRTAQSRAWQRQVAEVAYQHNHPPRPSGSYQSTDGDGFLWLVCGVTVAAGLAWLLGKARETAMASSPPQTQPPDAEPGTAHQRG